MTVAEQKNRINKKEFYDELRSKVKAIMELDLKWSGWLKTDISDIHVEIDWDGPNKNVLIRVGQDPDASNAPLYDLTLPSKWVFE